MEDAKERIAELKEEKAEMKTENQQLKTEIVDLKKEIQELKAENKSLRESGSKISNSIHVTGNQTGTFSQYLQAASERAVDFLFDMEQSDDYFETKEDLMEEAVKANSDLSLQKRTGWKGVFSNMKNGPSQFVSAFLATFDPDAETKYVAEDPTKSNLKEKKVIEEAPYYSFMEEMARSVYHKEAEQPNWTKLWKEAIRAGLRARQAVAARQRRKKEQQTEETEEKRKAKQKEEEQEEEEEKQKQKEKEKQKGTTEKEKQKEKEEKQKENRTKPRMKPTGEETAEVTELEEAKNEDKPSKESAETPVRKSGRSNKPNPPYTPEEESKATEKKRARENEKANENADQNAGKRRKK